MIVGQFRPPVGHLGRVEEKLRQTIQILIETTDPSELTEFEPIEVNHTQFDGVQTGDSLELGTEVVFRVFSGSVKVSVIDDEDRVLSIRKFEASHRSYEGNGIQA